MSAIEILAVGEKTLLSDLSIVVACTKSRQRKQNERRKNQQ